MANIVRLDICEGKPRSFVFDEDVQNGYFLEITGKVENVFLNGVDYEAYAVELADKDSKMEDVLFHKSVENMYDERMMKQDFVLEAGKVGRGYVVTRGDIVTIPATMVNTQELNAKLALANGGKLKAVEEDDIAIAVIEAVEDIVIPGAEPQESIVIRFL